MSYNKGFRYVAYDAANGEYQEFKTKEDALEAVRMARKDEKRVVKEKCEKLFRGFLLKAFLKSASNEPFDQEGEFKKLMDKI